MRNISMLGIILLVSTNLLSMDNEEKSEVALCLKAFRQGPTRMYVSNSESGVWEVMILESNETNFTMEVIPFDAISKLVRAAYEAMEENVEETIQGRDEKTKKELFKFHNFMKDKDLPQQIPSIRDVAAVINEQSINYQSGTEKTDRVEKVIKKMISRLNEKLSIVEYINKAAQDHEGDTNKAWQAAVEQIKICRETYRNAYLNNNPESCKATLIVHPKSLYYKNKDQAEQD